LGRLNKDTQLQQRRPSALINESFYFLQESNEKIIEYVVANMHGDKL